MMVIAVGLSSYNVALFHLVNHAFYKALLFLGAGAVIHAVADNQDFRKYGGLRPFLPLTYSVMLIASLSLVAFPFMTGFYSKDFILESAYGQFYFSSTVVYFIATIGAMFTTLYSVKVLYLTFLTNPAGPQVNYKIAHEGDIFMSLPLIILAVFSIFFGYITKDIFIGLGSGFFADNGLFIHPSHEIMLDTEFAVPTFFKLLPLMFTISLSIISIVLSEFYPKLLIHFKFSRLGYNIFSFFNQRFYVELFYNRYITDAILNLGGQTTKVLDKGSIELIGPFGLEKGLINLSKSIANLDTGVITSYALYILIGLISYILVPYISNNNLLIIILFGLFVLVSDNQPKPPIYTSTLKSGFIISKRLVVSLLISIFFIFSYKIPLKHILIALNAMPLIYILYGAISVCIFYIIKNIFIEKDCSYTKYIVVGLTSTFISFISINYLYGLAFISVPLFLDLITILPFKLPSSLKTNLAGLFEYKQKALMGAAFSENSNWIAPNVKGLNFNMDNNSSNINVTRSGIEAANSPVLSISDANLTEAQLNEVTAIRDLFSLAPVPVNWKVPTINVEGSLKLVPHKVGNIYNHDVKIFIQKNEGWEFVCTLRGHPGISEVFANLKIRSAKNQLVRYSPYGAAHRDKPLILHMYGKNIDLNVRTHPNFSHQGRTINPLAIPLHLADMGLQIGEVVKPSQILQRANYSDAMWQDISRMRKERSEELKHKRSRGEVD